MTNHTPLIHLLETAGISLGNSCTHYPDLHQPGDSGLPMLLIENPLGRTVIALQGAHLMSFQPAGQREMLWVSPRCVLQTGQPIRAGIPLCLPWFGPGPDGKSMHGFARTTDWTPLEAEVMENGATRLVMGLAGDESYCALWPHAFEFRLEIEVGSTLKLTMHAENHGTEAAPLAFAFHTYLAVPDVSKARVSGLEDSTYIDKTDNFARRQQAGEVTISAPTDRIYLDVAARQSVHSGAGSVNIDSDANCCIVWNAWTNDKNMADLGEGNHVGYLCVERGDVAERSVTLPPGGHYTTRLTLAC